MSGAATDAIGSDAGPTVGSEAAFLARSVVLPGDGRLSGNAFARMARSMLDEFSVSQGILGIANPSVGPNLRAAQPWGGRS